MPSKREARQRDASVARKNRRKGGKRKKGQTVAAHCSRCRKRPAEPGQIMCIQCYRLPICAGMNCSHRVDIAGALCPSCQAAIFGAG